MESSGDRERSNSRVVDNDGTITGSHEEEKTKLRREIQELKALNFEIECCLKITKFGDIEHLLNCQKSTSSFSLKKIPDVDIEYTDELFQLAGMHCTMLTDNKYIFSFVSSGNLNSKNRNYAVEIIHDSDKPKLGKWNMPISTNMDSLLLETPLRKPIDIKPFLANCKHRINCFSRREKQYEDLQTVLKDLSGCSLDSNLGYTVITLKLFQVKVGDPKTSYNIILYLIYDASTVRPHKITVDSLAEKTLPKDVENKCKTHFKHFKRYELKKAFEQTYEATDSPVQWMKGKDGDELDLDENDESDSEKDVRLEKRKLKRPRKLKRKVADTSFPSQDSASLEQRLAGSDFEEPGTADSIDEGRKERSENKVDNQRAKKKQNKKKRVETSEVSKAPKAVLNNFEPKKAGKKVPEAGNDTSRRNLRQSTLKVQFVEAKEDGEAEPVTRTLSTKQISPIRKSNLQRVSIARRETLGNLEFGTSTPVQNLNSKKKLFVNDDSKEMSPINPKPNAISIIKSRAKKTK